MDTAPQNKIRPTSQATITIDGRSYSAPQSVLDLSVRALVAADMPVNLARVVCSRGLKLYAHGVAQLGYGVFATIQGQS